MSYSTTASHGEHHEHPTGIMRWFTTTNHKDIGTMYLVFSLIMFITGGIMILSVRAELFQPGLQLISERDDEYIFFSQHSRKPNVRRIVFLLSYQPFH